MNNKCSPTVTDGHVSEKAAPNYKGGRGGMSHVLKLQRWLVVEGVCWNVMSIAACGGVARGFLWAYWTHGSVMAQLLPRSTVTDFYWLS